MPILEQMVTPEPRALLRDPETLRVVNGLFNWFVLVIFLNAAWNAYTATRQSQRAWVLVNLFGTFNLTTFFVIGALVYQSVVA